MAVNAKKITLDHFELLCSECGEVSFTIKTGIPKHLDEESVIFEGVTHSKAIDLKYGKKIFKFLENNNIKELHNFLKRKKLLDNGIDAYCPDCDKIYCRKDYHINSIIDDEGFYDYTNGCCPKMHERIVDD
ncbi:MAG TPA: hypothetical protein PK771_02100 [Spirochaetota bacterium]|nr:hypothetical protein [Spirochaetota bacterium]